MAELSRPTRIRVEPAAREECGSSDRFWHVRRSRRIFHGTLAERRIWVQRPVWRHDCATVRGSRGDQLRIGRGLLRCSIRHDGTSATAEQSDRVAALIHNQSDLAADARSLFTPTCTEPTAICPGNFPFLFGGYDPKTLCRIRRTGVSTPMATHEHVMLRSRTRWESRTTRNASDTVQPAHYRYCAKSG